MRCLVCRVSLVVAHVVLPPRRPVCLRGGRSGGAGKCDRRGRRRAVGSPFAWFPRGEGRVEPWVVSGRSGLRRLWTPHRRGESRPYALPSLCRDGMSTGRVPLPVYLRGLRRVCCTDGFPFRPLRGTTGTTARGVPHFPKGCLRLTSPERHSGVPGPFRKTLRGRRGVWVEYVSVGVDTPHTELPSH